MHPPIPSIATSALKMKTTRWHLPAKLHGAKTHINVTTIFTAMKT
jgi:hypothetical protein